jgi:hypothetical protein
VGHKRQGKEGSRHKGAGGEEVGGGIETRNLRQTSRVGANNFCFTHSTSCAQQKNTYTQRRMTCAKSFFFAQIHTH